MAGLGAPELIILFMVLAFVVLPVWGIIDAATKPESVWAAAGQNKIVWVVVQIFLGALGAAVYFLAIRPQLKRATAA
jgi:hypothetical protein